MLNTEFFSEKHQVLDLKILEFWGLSRWQDTKTKTETEAFLSHLGLKGPHRKLVKEEGTLWVSGIPLACELTGQIPANHLPCVRQKRNRQRSLPFVEVTF